MAAGALAMVMMAPRAVAGSDPSSPLQPVIDQLFDAQQQITDTNSAFPNNFSFIVPSDLSMLHEYEQMLAGTMLASEFNMLARYQFGDVVIPWAPYPWSANAADPQPFLTYNNPDD
ncbi:MAG TPA: hypothetical protein VFQ37_08820, partial [Mycobacterium sp.]|nr:hypothetical protein [Mycobacterium sp.]